MEDTECNSNPHTAAVLNTDVSTSKKAAILDGQDRHAQEALMLDPHHDSLLAFNTACDKKKALHDDNYTFRRPEEFEDELEEVHDVVREVTLLVEAASGSARSHDAQRPQFSDVRGLSDSTLNPILNPLRGNDDPNGEKGPNEGNDKSYSSESGPASVHPNSCDASNESEEDQAPYIALDNCREAAPKEYSDSYGTLEKDDGTSEYEAERGPIASEQEYMPVHETHPPEVPPQASSRQQDNSWTSSMTWGIDMEKARKRWAHIRANMARNGLDKSPFVPRSFQEYIELKLKSTRPAAEEATKQLIQLEDHAENLCAGKPLDQLAGTLVIPKCLLDPAKNPSGLSPVLCRRSIWIGPVHSHGNTDWASRTELNEAGDKCIIEGRSRFFPVPRINKLDGQSPQLALSEQEARELDEPTQELELSEIHYLTRELIERIRNMD